MKYVVESFELCETDYYDFVQKVLVVSFFTTILWFNVNREALNFIIYGSSQGFEIFRRNFLVSVTGVTEIFICVTFSFFLFTKIQRFDIFRENLVSVTEIFFCDTFSFFLFTIYI